MHRFGGSHAIAAAGADILDTVAVRVAACWLAGCVARAFAARCIIALYAVHTNIVPALFQNEITEGFCRFCDAPSDARVIADFQVAGFGCRLEFLIMIRAAPAAILHAVLDVPKVYTLMQGSSYHTFYRSCERSRADVQLVAGHIPSLQRFGYGNVSICLGRTLYRDNRFFQLIVKILCI